MGVSAAGEGPSPQGSEVAIEVAEGSIEQFAPRDDHQVESHVRRPLHEPEDLSNQSFSPVSVNRVAELPRRDDTKPNPRRRAGRIEQREKSGRDARARVEDPAELAAPSHPLRLAERVRRQGCAKLARRDREALPPLGPAALQHQTAVLGRHPRQKPVGLLTAAAVWLESTLHDLEPLHVDGNNSEKPRYYRPIRPTVNVREVCYSPLPATSIGSPPEVFHNCGKKCGKA